MNRVEYRSLLSEKTALERLLQATPVENVIDRASLLARLEDAQHRLSSFRGGEREPARARLTFRGAPVVGSSGIAAEFGAKAIHSFTEAMAAMAASLHRPLAAMGPIPNRDQHQLLITGTALGSFGFELQERESEDSEVGELAAVSQAMERTRELLQATLGTDEELADSASDTDPRALDKVRSFLRTLAESDAVCTVQVGEAAVRFTDVGQIRTSLKRLSQENLHEEEQDLKGWVRGVLPTARVFEFARVGADQQVLRIRIGATVHDANALNEQLNKPLEIRVSVTRVGNGPPRFTLLAWSEARPLSFPLF